MTEAMLGSHRQIDGLLDAGDSHHRQHGHHLLRPDQVVLHGDLGNRQPHPVVDGDPDLAEDTAGVFADPSLIH